MDVGTLRQTVDLFALAARDVRLRRVASNFLAGPCPFCGGVDRFVVKRTPDGYRWLCRHCSPKYQDAIAYAMRRDGLDFKAAVKTLGGASLPLRDDDLPPQRAKAEAEAQDPETVARLTYLALEAVRRRLDDEFMGPIFEKYLKMRALTLEMADLALLGIAWVYDPKLRRERAAISIPYVKNGFEIHGVKFRFADDAPGGLRYTMAQGSKAGLYSLPERLGRSKRLLIVEGELNLLSAAQVTDDLDCVSTGSQTLPESAKRELVHLARDYQRVIVWMDEPQKAVEVAGLVRGTPIKSPVVDGHKMDANQMLQEGVLDKFLPKLLSSL